MTSAFSTDFDTQQVGARPAIPAPTATARWCPSAKATSRCQVGHAWTAEALLGAQDDEVESALRVALRSLQEKARLAGKAGAGMAFRRYTAIAEETERALAVLSGRLSTTAPHNGKPGD